ncbi:MAG: hypothetical protein M3P39_07215, partial [Actinomycetota bacterium]|nr:hypothetical protein [Actinomycetota bacterium]
MFERFGDQARQAVVLAHDESRELGHELIAAEHLLLGVLGGGSAAAERLSGLGAGEEAVRAEALRWLGRGPAARGHVVPLTTSAQRALVRAPGVADEDGDECRRRRPPRRRAGRGRVGGRGPPGAGWGSAAVVREALAATPPLGGGLGVAGADPGGPDPVVVELGGTTLGNLGNARVDAGLLLAVALRGGQVAGWLRERGIDQPAIRERFGAL